MTEFPVKMNPRTETPKGLRLHIGVCAVTVNASPPEKPVLSGSESLISMPSCSTA